MSFNVESTSIRVMVSNTHKAMKSQNPSCFGLDLAKIGKDSQVVAKQASTLLCDMSSSVEDNNDENCDASTQSSSSSFSSSQCDSSLSTLHNSDAIQGSSCICEHPHETSHSVKQDLKTDSSVFGKTKKTVSFGTIHIYTHEVVLGDNPAVSTGPPLSIGWTMWDQQCCTVEEYERLHPMRRNSGALRMPQSVREKLLRDEFGVARSYMKEVTEEMNKIKEQRRKSVRRGLWERLRQQLNKRKHLITMEKLRQDEK